LGAAYALSGRVPEALPPLEQVVEPGDAKSLTIYAVWLGESYLLAGRLEEALRLGQRALEAARTQKQQSCQTYALWLLGEIAAQRDPPDAEQAEASYQQALTLAKELGMRPLLAHCHRGLGTLYIRMRQLEQACMELFTTIDLYRAMEMTFWLPQAEAALAQVDGSR